MKYDRAVRVFTLFLLLVDMLMLGGAFLVAYFTRLAVPLPQPADIGPLSEYLGMLALHIGSVLVVLFFARLYNLGLSSRVDEFYGIVASCTIGTLMGIALGSLLLRDFNVGRDYSRAMLIYVWGFSIIFLSLGRLFNGWLRRSLIRRGWGRRRALIVGTGPIAQMILQKILWTPSLGYDVLGLVSSDGDATTAVLDVPVIGKTSQLGEIIVSFVADEVIIALPEETSHQEILWLISECERGRVTIRVYPDLFQIMAGPVGIGELGGLPLLTVRDIAQTGWRRVAKRLVDLIGSTAALVLLSPMMMAIAALIRLESPGGVFYAQERMGLDARPFPMIKFRSMRSDAEKTGPGWTTSDDPRRTRVGAFLRKTNLDELPQFINVLLGHMSLVGPRPERPVYVEQFRRSIPRYMERHREKAGMTGWAQVNGLRGDTSITERTKYDLWYIENWSLLLDIKIIVRTVLQFFRSPNAY